MTPTLNTQFSFKEFPNHVYTIVGITETRVIYNDGHRTFRGATNRKQSNWWMSIKKFEEQTKLGGKIIIQ